MYQLKNLTVNQLKRALEIQEKLEALQTELTQVLNGFAADVEIAKPGKAKGRKKLSASTRAAMAKAQQKRRSKENRVETAVESDKKPKRKMSAAGRAAIAAGAKKRWAAKKAAGMNTL